MKKYKRTFLIYSFYRFTNISNIKKIKKQLDLFLLKGNIKGTVLIAKEGINGTLSGHETDLQNCIKYIKKLINIKKLEVKINKNNFLPFKKLKVKLKNEIVTLAKGTIDVSKYGGKKVKPSEWNQLIQNENIKVLDVRNNYEINIGKFKYSEKPGTNNFREFPASIKKLKLEKNISIAMYCTGGIRCEKASAYLKSIGYKNVLQLEGGILKYLEYAKKEGIKSLWNGECFVFDDRVSVNKSLNKGKYLQCYGCRMPITEADKSSVYFQKGVSCPHCFTTRSKKQKFRSITRQMQIDKSEATGRDHSFKKIYI